MLAIKAGKVSQTTSPEGSLQRRLFSYHIVHQLTMIAVLLGFLSYSGPWALVVIFLVIALESSAFLGLFFPGEAVALIAGALVSAQIFSLGAAFATVATAAIAGDVVGYTLGHYWGQVVIWPAPVRATSPPARILFRAMGTATVLAGRFVAVGRAFVPFAAGLSEKPPRRFLPMAAFSGVLWGAVVVGAGYVLGSNWRLAERWARSLGAGALVLVVLTALMVVLWRWVTRRQSSIIAARRHLAERYGLDLAPFFEFVRDRLSPRSYLGLHLTVGLLAVGGLAWLFGSVAQDISAQDPLVRVDRAIALFIASHRSSDLDSFMAGFAFLSDARWMLCIVAAASIGTAFAGDVTLSITAVPIFGGAYVLAFGLQAIFSTFSPNVPAAQLVHGFVSFPSITLTAATAAYRTVCYNFQCIPRAGVCRRSA